MERSIKGNERNSGVGNIDTPTTERTGNASYAIGQIIEALSPPDENWLLCDGKSYYKYLYPELAANITTKAVSNAIIRNTELSSLTATENPFFFFLLATNDSVILTNYQDSTLNETVKILRIQNGGYNYTESILFPQTLRNSGNVVIVKNNQSNRLVAFYQNASVNLSDVHVSISDDNGLTWVEKPSLSSFGLVNINTAVWDGVYYRIFDANNTGKYAQSTDLVNWTVYNVPNGFLPTDPSVMLTVVRDSYYNGWVILITYDEVIKHLGPTPSESYPNNQLSRISQQNAIVNYSFDGNRYYLKDITSNKYISADNTFGLMYKELPETNNDIWYVFNICEIGTSGDILIPGNSFFENSDYLYLKNKNGPLEVIYLEQPIRIISSVSHYNGSVFSLCFDDETGEICFMTTAYDTWQFRVPGFEPSVGGLRKYIYAGPQQEPIAPQDTIMSPEELSAPQ
jgi:hypothetical protein